MMGVYPQAVWACSMWAMAIGGRWLDPRRARTGLLFSCVELGQKLCERLLQDLTHVSLVNGCGYFQPVV